MLNIAFFHHTLRLGSGIDTVIYELANRLGKRDNVTVFCFKTDYKQENCNFDLRQVNSPFADTTLKMMTLAPLILDKVGQLRSELKGYDLINTQHYPANYIVRNINGPTNIVTEWSAASSTLVSTLREKIYIEWCTHANRIAVEKADAVLAPCEFVRRWIHEHYNVDSTSLLLDGVNFEIFNRNKVTPDKVFELYPSLQHKKIILFVGRVTESKNIHTLIEAFHILKKNDSDVVLLIVGDYLNYRAYYEKLQRIISLEKLENNIIFTGVVPWEDLPAYFAASTIYATCSLWEGFLRAEAFALGKPIVCFNTGANSETVSDGKTGFLVNELSAKQFAQKMYELISNETLAKEMGENGYKWARDNLDFDVIADKFRSFCYEQNSYRNGKIIK